MCLCRVTVEDKPSAAGCGWKAFLRDSATGTLYPVLWNVKGKRVLIYSRSPEDGCILYDRGTWHSANPELVPSLLGRLSTEVLTYPGGFHVPLTQNGVLDFCSKASQYTDAYLTRQGYKVVMLPVEWRHEVARGYQADDADELVIVARRMRVSTTAKGKVVSTRDVDRWRRICMKNGRRVD